MARQDYSVIPTDDELREMPEEAINIIAIGLKNQPNAELLQERLSDALLRINTRLGSRPDAHSEISDTKRRRRICGKEWKIDPAMMDQVIPVSISEAAIRSNIIKAAKAGCTDRQCQAFILVEIEGMSQERAADMLDIKQPALSRLLARAKEALFDYIDRNDPAVKVFFAESNRYAYFKPSNRPNIPRDVEEARYKLENYTPVSTHIQLDAPRRVEVWLNEDPILLDELDQQTGAQKHFSLSFKSTMSWAKKNNVEIFLQTM